MKCWKHISMTKPIGIAPRKFIFMVLGDWGRKTSGGRLFCADRSGTETFHNKLKMHFVCTNALLAK